MVLFYCFGMVRGCVVVWVMLVGELTADGGGFFFLGVGGHVGLFVGVW
jgi:hypothetical protein